ncbi:hypothetical protein [Streptomyces sp. NPDC090025]|uniref:hypothetical protein n=1 Tax=Streptomyces sp. NPDC090025 TaxID=3365922 RepID=UPI0038346BCF
MTSTQRPAAPRTPAPVRTPRAPAALRALAIAACLPYITLKTVWIAGGRAGIPDGSVLLDHPTLMVVANGLSVVADAAVVVLALLLTRPWGLRVRAWVLVLPLWAATGLLAPIMLGYPAQVLAKLLLPPLAPSGTSSTPGTPEDGFLDPWVFPVVYGGFIVQGLCLGALALRYARDRWAPLWRGRLGELPSALTGPGVRAVAVAGGLLALGPVALRLLWAAGLTRGLSPGLVAVYDSDHAVVDVTRAVLLAVAAVSTPLLVLRRPARLRVRTAVALSWVASGGAGCWGAYLSLVALMPQDDPANRPTALMTAAYAGEMITGFLLAGCLAVVLRRRSGAV